MRRDSSTWVGIVLALLIAGFSFYYVNHRRAERWQELVDSPVTEGSPASEALPDSGPELSEGLDDATESSTSIPEEPVAVAPVEPITMPQNVIAFGGDTVVATVNGRAILGSELLPVPPRMAGLTREMSREMYEARLNEAIDRELVFETASAQGVSLTKEELSRLSEKPADDPNVTYLLGDREQMQQFARKQAEARLLERKLVEMTGSPGPDVTAAEVEAYYSEREDEFGPLPENAEEKAEAWPAIELQIRRILASEKRAQYTADRNAYVGELRSAADIQIVDPVRE